MGMFLKHRLNQQTRLNELQCLECTIQTIGPGLGLGFYDGIAIIGRAAQVATVWVWVWVWYG